MTETSCCSPAAAEKNVSLLSSKKYSISDMEGMTETQVHERADAPVTSAGSADDSRGLSTPDCDSIEVKLTPASRWATVQEALEACLDPFFLVGQSSIKDDRIAEELLQLLDTSLTAHVPALASVSFLQPFFDGSTRSERLDAVIDAARASNKLLLRDDLPVPSSSGFMLSVDETEAAGLRVGPRSHAEGVSRSTLSLERRHSTADAEEALRSVTLSQLQSTVPQHRIVKIERIEAPCVVRVVFVSPAAADRAYAVWRSHAPLGELRVVRVGGAAMGGKSMPAPPRPASDAARPVATTAATIVVPAPRTALKCPRVVGEALSRLSHCDNAAQTSGKTMATGVAAAAAAAAPPRPAMPVPKPPPAIDVVLPTSAKTAATPAASSDPSTTSTTPSPESSTTKSKFNTNAAPFLPKSVLEAQRAAVGWWPRGSRARCVPAGEEGSGMSMDTSEALANLMLMDSTSGWMYPGLDPYTGAGWANKFNAVDGWIDGTAGLCGEMPSLSPAMAGRNASLAMPERPKAVGGDMPVAPCALGDSPCLKELQPLAAVRTRADLYPPRPMAASLSPEQASAGCGCATFDGICAARRSPSSQTLPTSLPTSRRHRHDPYSPSGFVLCAECSCASSLTHPVGAGVPSPASSKFLSAASLTSEKMASFCFEDPLIKASARRRERRRQMLAEEEATRTSSSEAESSSLPLEGSQSAQPENSSSRSSATGDAAEPRSRDCAACEEAAAVAESGAAEAAEDCVVPTPKSYAEALRLKAKASPVPALVSAKSPESKKGKAGKATGVAEKRTGTVPATTASPASATNALSTPKTMTVAA